MSELSTVAIKDGHRGHPHHHSHMRPQTTTSTETAHRLDDERADRISRLAGLERVSTIRQSSTASLPPGASANHPHGGIDPGYFDTPIPPQSGLMKERSTVGSASATGSVGGRTTWASGSGSVGGSEQYDATDKMSEDAEASSDGGYSDEGNVSVASAVAPYPRDGKGTIPMTGILPTSVEGTGRSMGKDMNGRSGATIGSVDHLDGKQQLGKFSF